jgi:putative transposase
MKRRAVKMSIKEGWGNGAQACRALGIARSSYYHNGQKDPRKEQMKQEIIGLSEKHPRYGYRRITALLKRAGYKINAKRVARIRREEGWKVYKKQNRIKRLGISTTQRRRALRNNEVWSWNFVWDQTEGGSRFRILTLIDEYNRQCLAMYANWSIRAEDVIRMVQEAISRYGTPEHLRSDNGPEFIAYRIQDWLLSQQIKIMYIKPGSPWENGHIESFHDKLRDECLNREVFSSLQEARIIIEGWRKEYNAFRPHSALGYQTPQDYAQRCTKQSDGGCAPPNPAPLAAAGVQGEQGGGATAPMWQENQTTETLVELSF